MVHLGDWIFRHLGFPFLGYFLLFLDDVKCMGWLPGRQRVVPQLSQDTSGLVYLAECPHRLCIRKGVNADQSVCAIETLVCIMDYFLIFCSLLE